MKIWFDAPANVYTEALPVGNGRQGAMIYGGVEDETISMNEDSIWYGRDIERDNPLSKDNLKKIREYLISDKVEEAEDLAMQTMMSSPQYLGSYLPVGDLKIHFYNHKGNVSDYKRELCLIEGVSRISYKINGIRYTREIIASYEDNAIIMKVTADRPGKVGFRANLFRRPYDSGTDCIDESTVAMRGECGKNGQEFRTVLRAVADGGVVETRGGFLVVKNANSVFLAVCSCSTYRFSRPLDAALEILSNINYSSAFTRHIAEHSEKMNRVSLELGEGTGELPTDRRIELFKRGEEDTDLYALFFQYGRYLLLASSRPGSLPSNLQGLWNNSFEPNWESKYVVNINTEMNYWPAEVCNLSECHEPLLGFLDILRKNGAKTAEKMYGAAGFAVHHNTYIWGNCSVDTPLINCAIWPMGGGWLSLHLWERYLFTGDEQYLKNYSYPIMKQACQFFLSYMTEYNGKLLTGPSVSPENAYISKRGNKVSLCMAPSMDCQIVKELFGACIEAGKIIGDFEFIHILEGAIRKIPDIRIGSDGRILEWQEEYEEYDKGHRHFSHLFGLYPGTTINTEALKEAANKTLECRLAHGSGTGWSFSFAWLTNLYARLGNGKKALKYLDMMIKQYTQPNLFTTGISNEGYPAFQIDGNLGSCAGIAEMLVQSHNGYIELLPALPDKWKRGRVKGIMARGGYEVDISWNNGKLTEYRIKSKNEAKPCKIIYNGAEIGLSE